MSSELDLIFNACDPFLPANENYYCECRDARGGDYFIENVFDYLKRFNRNTEKNPGKRYCHFLFSGHSGSGKSSELKHLVKKLQKPNKHNVNFYPVYIDTDDYLDVNDVSITEILLSVVTELAESLRKELGIQLQDSYFQRRFDEFKSYLLSEVELNEGELTLGFAKLKIQRLKQDRAARIVVRDSLKPRLPNVLEEINLLFEQARLAIRKNVFGEYSLNYSDIVIIIDNLEKINKFEDASEGIESYEKLFDDYYPQLSGLQAHIIFTTPLRLVRSTIAPKLKNYYSEPYVLPMVKIAYRDTREPFEEGFNALKTILQKRLGNIPLEKAFTDDALNFLIKYSGGSIRDLMSFARGASTKTDNLPITLSDVQKAIRQTIQTLSTAIPEGHWAKLAALDLSPTQRFANDDDEYREMLGNLSVLEYINGGDDDIWQEVAPWYAVHPIVRELLQFKDARKKILEEESKITK